MTPEQLNRIKKIHKQYEGFGDRRSAATWARISGIPRSTFHRYLQQGLTVEQIFELRGCTYTAENPKSTTRKPRHGARMEETRLAMVELLSSSGYPVEAYESVGVRPLNGTRQVVTYKGRPVGQYNYKTGVLYLGNGESLRVREPIVEEPKILRGSYGMWEIHPVTRRKIFLTTNRK